MTMRIFTVGPILSVLIAVGGCTQTTHRPAYPTPPAIVQSTPIQSAPYATPPIQVQTLPPGAVVPGTPGCTNCPPPPPPQPFVPHN